MQMEPRGSSAERGACPESALVIQDHVVSLRLTVRDTMAPWGHRTQAREKRWQAWHERRLREAEVPLRCLRA